MGDCHTTTRLDVFLQKFIVEMMLMKPWVDLVIVPQKTYYMEKAVTWL